MKVLEILAPTQKYKKYAARVIWEGKELLVNFGDNRYEQYKDRTPLKLWSHLDHNDLKRRQSYLSRHQHDNKPAGILARKYLW